MLFVPPRRDLMLDKERPIYFIVFHISNFTVLSVGILDDVLLCTPTRIPPSGLVKFDI